MSERVPEPLTAERLDELTELVASLTEGTTPGPWHGVTEYDPPGDARWWLDNEAGDSSFPTADDVAMMLNALPALLVAARESRAGSGLDALDVSRLETALNHSMPVIHLDGADFRSPASYAHAVATAYGAGIKSVSIVPETLALALGTSGVLDVDVALAYRVAAEYARLTNQPAAAPPPDEREGLDVARQALRDIADAWPGEVAEPPAREEAERGR